MTSGDNEPVTRADLLWSLQDISNESQQVRTAELLGYVVKEDVPEIEKTPNNQANESKESKKNSSDRPSKNSNFIEEKSIKTGLASYYRLVAHQQEHGASSQFSGDISDLPNWFTNAKPNLLKQSKTRIPPIHHISPKHTPLVTWSRLWPMLQSVLGGELDSLKPDISKLVENLAKGGFIKNLPRAKHYTWSPDSSILIDINPENFNFRKDFILLREQLEQLRGKEGLDIQYIYDEPGSYISRYKKQTEEIEPWEIPNKLTPLLILSDLGLHSNTRFRLYQWLDLGHSLFTNGIRPSVLLPVAERQIDRRLLKYFDCIVWDKASRLKPIQGEKESANKHQNDTTNTHTLLSYLHASVRADNNLIRAIRDLLPVTNFDVSHEASVWRSSALNTEGDEWCWNESRKQNYREDAEKLVSQLNDEQQEKIIHRIASYHAQLPDELYFEAMYGLMLLGFKLPKEVEVSTLDFMADMVRTYAENPQDAGFNTWVKHHIARFSDPIYRDKHQFFIAFLAFSTEFQAKQEGNSQIDNWPENLTDEEKTQILAFINHHRKTKPYVLRQQGMSITLESLSENTSLKQNDDWEEGAKQGIDLLHLKLSDTHIFHQKVNKQGNKKTVSYRLNEKDKSIFEFSADQQHEFNIGSQKFTIDVIAAGQEQGNWIKGRGNTEEGFYVESKDQNDESYLWYWHAPEIRQIETRENQKWKSYFYPGFWHSYPPQAKFNTPNWAVDTGRDQYGLWADADIAGIQHRFRWIEPTSFMMGSPDGKNAEKGRLGNETQHEVILTQGYWLAETTCTQELWQAVTGSNPSGFKGKDKPVEQVSWEDINNQFLVKLNKQQPELALRFPTEAEWENACRAGTTAAFNFEKEISLDQFNYRGTWDDYDNYGEGAFKQTTEVKKYQPNRWGLYQMHGNVLEWCNDWYGDYPAEQVIDPTGSESGTSRVLRGGSWIINGRYCRSAGRSISAPDGRDFNIGFRLARGQRAQDFAEQKNKPAKKGLFRQMKDRITRK